MRCVEKITKCPGHAKKSEASRQKNMTKEKRRDHMKKMSTKGNQKLAQLHKDEQWRRNKGANVSKSKATIPHDQLSSWKIYESIVDRITRESWIYHHDKINPDNITRGKDYELDHKYSKHQGFLNNVSPEMIGHYSNLQMISRYSNRKKYNKCSISINKLYEGIK